MKICARSDPIAWEGRVVAPLIIMCRHCIDKGASRVHVVRKSTANVLKHECAYKLQSNWMEK